MAYVIGDEDSEYRIEVDYGAYSYPFGSYCYFYIQDEGHGIKEHLGLEEVNKLIAELTKVRDKLVQDGAE